MRVFNALNFSFGKIFSVRLCFKIEATVKIPHVCNYHVAIICKADQPPLPLFFFSPVTEYYSSSMTIVAAGLVCFL